jgi:anti-sigma B factor antagonist
MPSRVETSSGEQSRSPAFRIVDHTLDQRTCVIAVEGELDLDKAPRLKWTLVGALEAGCDRLVVDLSRVAFIDSTAIGVLIGVNRSLEAGGRLAIACAQANVLRIFSVAGLDSAFAILPTVEEALDHVRGQAARVG